MVTIINDSQNKATQIVEKTSNYHNKHNIFNETPLKHGFTTKKQYAKYIKEWIGFKCFDHGNKCGIYNRTELEKYSTRILNEKNHLPVISEAIKKLPSLFDRPDFLPMLFKHKTGRSVRAESRFMTILLYMYLLSELELLSGRVGCRLDPAFNNDFKTNHYIARKLKKSLSRILRNIKRLKISGLITVKPRCENLENGHFKGLAAVKVIHKEIFILLGLKKQYDQSIKYVTKLREKIESSHQKAIIKAVIRQINPSPPLEKSDIIYSDEPNTNEINKRVLSAVDIVEAMRERHDKNYKPANSDPPQT